MMTPSLSDAHADSLVTDAVTITKVDPAWQDAAGHAVAFLRHSGQPVGADALPIYRERVKVLAERFCSQHVPVRLEIVRAAVSGRPYVKDLIRAATPQRDARCIPRCRWQWATATVLRCQRCGRIKKSGWDDEY
jgi:hypothetical protein